MGKFIAEKRVQQGMTQIQLARIIGVTSAYISRVEAGLKRPSNESFLARVSNAFHLSQSENAAFLRLAKASQRSVQLPENTPLRGYNLISTLALYMPRLSDQQLLLLDSIIKLTCKELNSEKEDIM